MSTYYFDPNHVYTRKPSNTKKGQVIQKKIIDESRYYTSSDIKRVVQFLNNNPSINPWYAPYLFVPYVYTYHNEELLDPEDFDFIYNNISTQDDWIIHGVSNLVRIPTLLAGNFMSSCRYDSNLTTLVIYKFSDTNLISYSGFDLNSNGNLTLPDRYLPISTTSTIQFEMNIDTTLADTATALISLSILSNSSPLFIGYATFAFKPIQNDKFLNLSVGPSSAKLVYLDANYQALKDFVPDFNK